MDDAPRPERLRPLCWVIAVLALLVTITASPASAASATLSLDRTSYAEGETMVVTYAAGTQVSSTNWVAVYPAGTQPGGAPSPAWDYAPNASGSVTFTTDGLAAGNYNAYLLYNNTNAVLTSMAFSVSSLPRTLSLDRTAYAQGATITASYGTAQPSSTNWIGIYPDNGPKPVPNASLTWAYAPNAAGSVGLSTGSLPPGGYLAYYLANDGYDTQLGRPMHFYVTDGTTISQSTSHTPSFTLDKTTYAAGGTVTATYSTSQASVSPTNWIGIYPDNGGGPGATTSVTWKYAPTASGSVALTLPANLATGGYVAYFLYNNGFGTMSGGVSTDPVHFWVGTPPQASPVPQLDHVFVVMMENRAPGDLFGTTDNTPNPNPAAPAPYLDRLALDNVTLTNSHGVHHPSDPNYIALASGQTYLKGNNFPGVTGGGIGSVTAPHLGTLADQAGKTWKGYIEDMNGPCDLQAHAQHSHYDPDNLPFLFFSDMTDTTRCQNHLQPATQLSSDLQSAATTPNLVWLEPNSCHTMHDCTVTDGDSWMQNTIPAILDSPAFTQQRSLLVITWDEDANWTAADPIPTIVVGSPGLTRTSSTGFTSNNWYNHYSVTRTIEDGLGLSHAMTANDSNAMPVRDIWR